MFSWLKSNPIDAQNITFQDRRPDWTDANRMQNGSLIRQLGQSIHIDSPSDMQMPNAQQALLTGNVVEALLAVMHPEALRLLVEEKTTFKITAAQGANALLEADGFEIPQYGDVLGAYKHHAQQGKIVYVSLDLEPNQSLSTLSVETARRLNENLAHEGFHAADSFVDETIGYRESLNTPIRYAGVEQTTNCYRISEMVINGSQLTLQHKETAVFHARTADAYPDTVVSFDDVISLICDKDFLQELDDEYAKDIDEFLVATIADIGECFPEASRSIDELQRAIARKNDAEKMHDRAYWTINFIGHLMAQEGVIECYTPGQTADMQKVGEYIESIQDDLSSELYAHPGSETLTYLVGKMTIMPNLMRLFAPNLCPLYEEHIATGQAFEQARAISAAYTGEDKGASAAWTQRTQEMGSPANYKG